MNNSLKPIEILLVEDNPADVRLVIEVFKDFKLDNRLHTVEDGVEALDFLYNREKYGDMPKPDVIILDLNLPRKDGRKVLEEIKKDDTLKYIPIVILTTSSNREDVIQTYKHHANCFITKPVDFDQFMNIIKSIENFWLTVVRLPCKNE